MAKDESTSRVETRAFLQDLHLALGQPPLHAQVRRAVIGLLGLLSEQDVDVRYALRERVAELLAAEGSEQ